MKKKFAVEEPTEVPPTKKSKFEDAPPSKNVAKKSEEKFKKLDKNPKPKTFSKNGKAFPQNQQQQPMEKVEDWNQFKKEKKELKLKRKQERSGEGFDVITKAKQMSERLRQKTLKGGEEERTQLINQLHSLLKGKGHYAKFVLAHDTARIVQWLLKYASSFVVEQISKEIIPVTVDMLLSKYGVHCARRLLKKGSQETKSAVINALLGNCVKLASHSFSSPVLEYAYSTWATPTQKQYLIQEFFGDLYKNSKDSNVKHLRDIYKDNETLKAATLGATKANLMRILNKSLLDSGLVQSVLCQFLSECSHEDRQELISQLAPHIVVISNSKDGARAAMQCIWHGTNKDRKVIVKALKENLIELAKHEHGHCTIITLLDCADDTVLLQKAVLSTILSSAKELAVSEWGRKVLLWLVAPADSRRFHPVFIKELKVGREASSAKKDPITRQKEILSASIGTLLELLINDPEFWLSNSSLASEMVTIVKAGSGEKLPEAYSSIVKVITNLDWKIKDGDKEVLGIEHSGLHMTLKKLAQHDKTNLQNENATFGACLVENLTKDVLKSWLVLNRGCFLLVLVFENNSVETQENLKEKLKKMVKLLKSQESAGAKILLKKLE